MLELRHCGACHEAVSLYAAQCPHCHHPLKGAYSLRIASAALALLLPLVFFLKARVEEAPTSRLAGISDDRYARCLALSRFHEEIVSREGATAVEALARMNRWHAECSRKALRDIIAGSGVEVPASPAGWLTLEATPRPTEEIPGPGRGTQP